MESAIIPFLQVETVYVIEFLAWFNLNILKIKRPVFIRSLRPQNMNIKSKHNTYLKFLLAMPFPFSASGFHSPAHSQAFLRLSAGLKPKQLVFPVVQIAIW